LHFSGIFLVSLTMFEHLTAYAGDPILTLQQTYQQDARPEKVNLSIGVYYDEQGRIPCLESVQRARQIVLADTEPCTYLPMSGNPDYCQAVQHLVFGEDCPALKARRVATIQTVGSSGALRMGVDLLRRLFPDAQVWVSEPTWDNHRALIEGVGFSVNSYRYFDYASQRLDIDGMVQSLSQLPARSIVLLQPSCHNPTGADLTPEQWQRVISVVMQRELLPLLDLAYQGFAQGIREDAWLVRALVDAQASFLVVNSFSKTFALYGERCGALSLVCANADQADRALGQLQQTVRRNYSSPPRFGCQLVQTVLQTPTLRALWEAEVGTMRTRMHTMRTRLVEALNQHHPDYDWRFLLAQRGMFSYAPVLGPHMRQLRETFGVYILDSGRLCVAGLNEHSVERVAQAFATVLKQGAGT